MRAWILLGLGVLSLAGCRPSATVQRTTPLANLQPYKGLLVRGTRTSRRTDRLAYLLENAAVARIRNRCAFLDVRPARRHDEAGPDDLMLDVTVQRAYRGGGGGLVQNENLATVEVKLVLSDGADQELVGAADIQGKSSGLVIGGQESPEEEAINTVADSIANLLAQSGCTGQRVARARPTERPQRPDEGEEGATVELAANADAATRAEAENDEGKRLFRSADVAGAKTHFEAAIHLHRDPRYVFNLCLAQEDLGSLDEAEGTCQEVLAMKPDRALADKVKLRLKIIAEKRQQ